VGVRPPKFPNGSSSNNVTLACAAALTISNDIAIRGSILLTYLQATSQSLKPSKIGASVNSQLEEMPNFSHFVSSRARHLNDPLECDFMDCGVVRRSFSILILISCFCSSNYAAVIVIGFVGGFVHRNDSVHQEVQLANHLSQDYGSGMEVRIFENHSGSQAYQEVLRLLDSNHDGNLSAEEKGQARIVLYGHSWGASEAVALARTLQKNSVNVLLTIQVDSVSKPGKDDKLIPSNVAQAVNFYQLDGLLHGQRQIVAADPRRTQILGNIQLDYKDNPVNCDGYPWYARMFMKPHIEIESDPKVWNQIESLIRSKLP